MASRVNIRRRQLAQALLQLRKEAGLTQEQVAAHLECSKGKIWQMETGRVAVGTPELMMLFALLEVSGETQGRLLELARQGRSRERVWWQAYDDAVPEPFGRYLDLERIATRLDYFASTLVPGLLQTAGYAEALFAAAGSSHPKAMAAQLTQLRLERQERLHADPPLRLWAVIDEAVLHRLVGGAKIMRDQIDKLIEVSDLDNVTVQILPFSAGAHLGQNGAFLIMGFGEPDGPPAVYQESLVGYVYLERPADVERYSIAYDQLRAAGLSPADSIELMREVKVALSD